MPFLVMAMLLAAALAAAGMLMRSQNKKPRYQNPSLHEGRWEGPTIDGRHGQVRVMWVQPSHTICVGTNHGAKTCTIGPGMAHVDVCDCGAKRYGVYGTWS